MQHLSYVPSFGILSTYAPTRCGLATFSEALAAGLLAKGADVSVVRITDGEATTDANVAGELVPGSSQSVQDAVEVLNNSDVAIIQHEYGVYGGPDGDEVVDVMSGLRVPSIVIAHTVLKDPTPEQRSVLERVVALAHQVVVMSVEAHRRLTTGFSVDSRKISTIPHGAIVSGTEAPTLASRPTILTWGLLGPGKGIERVIDAMVSLRQLPNAPRYLVAGSTHPKVVAAHGEKYRETLFEQARRLGVSDSVSFDDAYRTPAELGELIRSAAVVVLPYDSRDQATSGVLVDSLVTGRPIVATDFPHARELLAGGAGTVVDHDDPGALVHALSRVLTNPREADAMTSRAREVAPTLAWPVVSKAYVRLGQQLVAGQWAVT